MANRPKVVVDPELRVVYISSSKFVTESFLKKLIDKHPHLRFEWFIPWRAHRRRIEASIQPPPFRSEKERSEFYLRLRSELEGSVIAQQKRQLRKAGVYRQK